MASIGGGGGWTAQFDSHRNPIWLNVITGQTVYRQGGGLSPVQMPMQVQVPYVASPPQLPYTPPIGVPRGISGTAPPPLVLPSVTWQEHYTQNGSKYWVHSTTGAVTSRDPYY